MIESSRGGSHFSLVIVRPSTNPNCDVGNAWSDRLDRPLVLGDRDQRAFATKHLATNGDIGADRRQLIGFERNSSIADFNGYAAIHILYLS